MDEDGAARFLVLLPSEEERLTPECWEVMGTGSVNIATAAAAKAPTAVTIPTKLPILMVAASSDNASTLLSPLSIGSRQQCLKN